VYKRFPVLKVQLVHFLYRPDTSVAVSVHIPKRKPPGPPPGPPPPLSDDDDDDEEENGVDEDIDGKPETG